MPLLITEKLSFIHAMTIVDPKCRVPSRQLITVDYLPKVYNQIMIKLKNACSSAQFVALAFDGWTDRLKAHLLAFNPLSGETYILI